jgi:hypothetical protein
MLSSNAAKNGCTGQNLPFLEKLDVIWDQLFSAEQTPIMRLLVEKVVVSSDDFDA